MIFEGSWQYRINTVLFSRPCVQTVPLPSLVLAFRSGGAAACCGSAGAGGGGAAGVTSATMVSTAAGTLAVASAALAAAAPLRGLLVLNSRHFAPRTIIIFDTAILGFLAAISGLQGGGDRESSAKLKSKSRPGKEKKQKGELYLTNWLKAL